MNERTGRGRPRDAAADRAILQAALALFIDKGVEGVSIEQIAKRAGVGKPTIYRRWSGKEDLLAAAIETEKRLREENEAMLLRSMEELCSRIQGELDEERTEREGSTATLLKLLDQVCVRVLDERQHLV